MMTGVSQQFCVRWNSHLGSLGAAFPQLLAGQRFVDVTLACDGHQVHCHRLVLAACSSYFESLLSENPCKHPIIILPKEIKLWEIHALVDFMYKGQVNVSQAGLPQLLKCAETLQIRGLCGTDSTLNEVANGKSERCDTLGSNLPNSSSSNFNFTSMFASNLLSANCQSDDDQQSSLAPQLRPQHHPPPQQNCSFGTDAALDAKSSTSSANHRNNETLVKSKTHKNANDNISKDNFNPMLSTSKQNYKRFSENDTSNTGSSELNIKCEEIDSDANAADDGMEDDMDEHLNSKLQTERTNQPNDGDKTQLDNDSNNVESVLDADGDSILDNPLDSIETVSELVNQDCSDVVVKRGSLSISVQKFAKLNDSGEIDNEKSRTEKQGGSRGRNDYEDVEITAISQDSDFYDIQQTVASKLPASLRFNRNTMSIYVKSSNRQKQELLPSNGEAKASHRRNNSTEDSDNDQSEDIICSPVFIDGNEDDEDFIEACSDQKSFDPSESFEKHSNYDFDDAVQLVQSRHTSAADNSSSFEHFGVQKYEKSPGRSGSSKTNQNFSLMQLLSGNDDDRLRSTVFLRNPRGNQIRTYDPDALYAALMDVKAGESIYRASQVHKVPRKTLRNWMKRWNIKSVYPMPYQLKRAAERQKQIAIQCQKQRQLNETNTQNNSLDKYDAMANVVCEYAATDSSPTRPGRTVHLDDNGNGNSEYSPPSVSPPAKNFTGEGSGYYGGMSEPGRRIRRSESLLRQAADNVSRGQTFQTVSDMFQIPISTIRFFMARKGILPRRKRGRASTASLDVDDVNHHSPHNQPSIAIEPDTCNNKSSAENT